MVAGKQTVFLLQVPRGASTKRAILECTKLSTRVHTSHGVSPRGPIMQHAVLAWLLHAYGCTTINTCICHEQRHHRVHPCAGAKVAHAARCAAEAKETLRTAALARVGGARARSSMLDCVMTGCTMYYLANLGEILVPVSNFIYPFWG
jgi:hypothetical protein